MPLTIPIMPIYKGYKIHSEYPIVKPDNVSSIETCSQS